MLRKLLYSTGGRKLAWGLLVFAASIFYFERGKLTADQWIDLVKWTTPMVVAAIAAEGVAEKIAARGKAQE